MRRRTAQLTAILGCALYATTTNAGLPLGTEFTYQGQLKQGGVPVNSSADFKFTLFQTPDGKDLVETVLVHDVQIVHGLFTVELDFGGNFLQYEARWLEVAVRTPHDATDSLPFTTLAPLHAMTGAPYSLNTRGIQVNDIGNVGIGTDTPEYPLEVMTSGSRAIVSSTFSTSGIALFGRARATSGTNYGVFGQSLSTSGYGVHGVAEADSGLNYGVRGRTNSPDGYAGYFEGGRNFFQGNVGIGTNIPSFPLHVITSSSRAISGKTSGLFGVHGESTGTSGYGVYGINTANTGVNYGVYGACVKGNGVHGHVSATSGSSVGVFGDSASTEGVGVLGEGIATSGRNFGVKGKTRSPDGYAGYFEGGRNYFQGNVGMGTDSPDYQLQVVTSGTYGVHALTTALSGTTTGVFGRSDSTSGRGVYGFAAATSGVTYGVYSFTNSPDGYAGYFTGGKNYFQGKVGIGTDDPKQSLHNTGDYYGRGHFYLYAFQGDGSDGTAYLQARDDSGTSSIALQLRTQNAGDWVDALHIEADGSVGIGTTDPGAWTLAVNGVAAKSGGGSWSVFSDRRLKKNIKPLVSPLKKLLSLRGVTFEYRDPDQRLGLPGRQTGMIAQDVEQVFPEWVDKDEDGYRYVTVRGFEALTVEALRELRAEKNRELAERDTAIASLQADVAELRAQLQLLLSTSD